MFFFHAHCAHAVSVAKAACWASAREVAEAGVLVLLDEPHPHDSQPERGGERPGEDGTPQQDPLEGGAGAVVGSSPVLGSRPVLGSTISIAVATASEGFV